MFTIDILSPINAWSSRALILPPGVSFQVQMKYLHSILPNSLAFTIFILALCSFKDFIYEYCI